MEVLEAASVALQEHAALTIARLATTEGNRQQLLKAGSVPPLVSLLQSGTQKGKAKAAAALWNLAVSTCCKASIAQAGAIPLLVRLLDDPKSTEEVTSYVRRLIHAASHAAHH